MILVYALLLLIPLALALDCLRVELRDREPRAIFGIGLVALYLIVAYYALASAR